ncbi:MAG: hypothetical protein WBE26_15765 [Phycisphaerae bacterium]
MNFVGIDLHKKTISIFVVNQERDILNRKRFFCSDLERIVAFFESIKPFRVVVEATVGWKRVVPAGNRVALKQEWPVSPLRTLRNKLAGGP